MNHKRNENANAGVARLKSPVVDKPVTAEVKKVEIEVTASKSVVLKPSWSVAPSEDSQHLWPPCSSIEISIFVVGFAISWQSYLINASACGPWRTALWTLRGTKGPG